MSEHIKEQISAFFDGELPAVEQQLLLQRLRRDPALRAQWGRYQLIGDGLRQGLPPYVDLGLADRVMADVEALPAHRGGANVGRLAKSFVGLAVAASVAVVAVLAVQQLEAPQGGASDSAQLAVAPQTLPPPQAYVRVQQGAPAQAYAQVQQGAPPQSGNRLNEYLVNHNEYAASTGMPGMLPYVRIVGHEQK
ncbi:MAG: sigma-E factor negative regulatory protein [Thiohalobacteraceae bacterium]|nr:sigma-E factor negative regulatory protein [Gammaproteobacteria bacterium]